MIDILTEAANGAAKLDPHTAQQTLVILQKIYEKTLLEMWTTIMLTAGCLLVVLSLLCHILRLPRVSYFFIGVYGYTMTWVPAEMALYCGYIAIGLSIGAILKETINQPVKGKRKKVEPPPSHAAA